MDGRFFDDSGNVRVSSGQLEFYNGDGTTRRTVLRHVRMSKGVVQADYTYQTGIDAGIILHYQDPENFGVALLDDIGSSVVVRYVEFVDGKKQAARASGSGFSLTGGTSYTVKCVIDDDPGNSALQRLTVYVGGTQRLQTTTIDDTWSGGQVGFYRATSNVTTTVQWDNFKCGKDMNGDGDADDAGDYVYANYDFNDPGGGVTWQKITFSHDNAGNLTNDGLFQYKYDAWNRLTEIYYAAGDASVSGQRVAKYEYDGLFRRTRKVVNNQGSGVVHNSDESGAITGIQAGDREERYYYAGWNVVETRNGSDATLNQFSYGTQYVDEPIAYDRDTDNDGDCLDAGSRRYFYHQDANYRVVMLTNESGTVIERYDYSAYGEPTVLKGGTTEAGNTLCVSSVGNPLMHQGLFRDSESLSYQNRFRQLLSRHGRFAQRDPIGYKDGLNLLSYLFSNSFAFVDPSGLELRVSGDSKFQKKIEAALKKICPQVKIEPSGKVVIAPPPIQSRFCPAAPRQPRYPDGCATLNVIINSPKKYTIRETSMIGWVTDGIFNRVTGTITIREKAPIKDVKVTTKGETIVPEYWEIVAHEITHAFEDALGTMGAGKTEEVRAIDHTNAIIGDYNSRNSGNPNFTEIPLRDVNTHTVIDFDDP